MDAEIHVCGPAHRACKSAMRNSNYYEVGLAGPDCPNAIASGYACGYSDMIDCVDAHGCVSVPTGPGLGVTYDCNFIVKNGIALHEFG